MRIVVAMSGGVDSSVVAARLVKDGHEVIGMTLQLYNASGVKPGTCCAGRDIYDARRVADHLGIPHYVINAEKRFHESVVEGFVSAYAAGETPVPCIACNQGVKFNDLLGIARDLGADAMATGHYVRRIEGSRGAELHRPIDSDRDQSWFLFTITREQLEFLHFPLGEIHDKETVRCQAREFGLMVADKIDSQDLCFVTKGSYAQIVEQLRPDVAGSGDIVNGEGVILGHHRGISHYTVGQSKRLGQAAQYRGKRQMVVSIDSERRRLVVGPKSQGVIDRFFLRNQNWMIDHPIGPLVCHVQLRAKEKPRSAEISCLSSELVEVLLDEPALPTPGQACVFYEGSRVLGGGFILHPARG